MSTKSDRSRGRGAATFFAGALAIGLLLFLYRYLEHVASGHPIPVLEPFITEVSGVLGGAVLIWLLFIPYVRGRPLGRDTWPRRLPGYLAVAVVVSVGSTTWNLVAREALFRLAGLGDYDYGDMPVRYAMEFPVHVIGLTLVAAAVHGLDRYRAARERELRLSRLEASLARAQLQALQAQLQPHFLFNALNTISSVMYEDVASADRMIARLSDLLRHVLTLSRTQRISLEEELAILEPYLELMRARFRGGLDVAVEADDEARSALVPALLLQPLVENAARHGIPAPPAPARIRVRARLAGDELLLEVEDNGPGVAKPLDALLGRGIGLTNTAARLRALYGTGDLLSLENRPEGGLRVRVRIPQTGGDGGRVAAPITAEEAPWTASAS